MTLHPDSLVGSGNRQPENEVCITFLGCLQAKALLSEQKASEGSGKIKAIFPPGPFKSGLSRTLQVLKPYLPHATAILLS